MTNETTAAPAPHDPGRQFDLLARDLQSTVDELQAKVTTLKKFAVFVRTGPNAPTDPAILHLIYMGFLAEIKRLGWK